MICIGKTKCTSEKGLLLVNLWILFNLQLKTKPSANLVQLILAKCSLYGRISSLTSVKCTINVCK